MEVWKDIKGYEGLYQVSNEGRVKSLDRTVTYYSPRYGHTIDAHFKGKPMVFSVDDDGYYVVGLSKDGVQHQKRVNILVATTFIPNPQNKPMVGHLKRLPNGLEDKTANEVWNLAWMTARENANYGTFQERRVEKQKQLYNEGKWKKVWEGKKRPNHAKKLSIPIVEIKEDGTIVEWESTKICAETCGHNMAHLTNAVNGKNRKRGHYYKSSQFYKKDEYNKKLLEELSS